MDEEMYAQFYKIIQTLSEACQRSTRDELSYPMTVTVEGGDGKGRCIPIPNHAVPEVAASIGREMMRDLLRHPNVNEMFTKEQLLELEKMTARLSGHLQNLPSTVQN